VVQRFYQFRQNTLGEDLEMGNEGWRDEAIL